MSATLAGIYPPVATPFTSDGQLDLDAMKHNVERWNKTGLSGYVVLGSNGESVFLDDAEKLTLLETVVAAAAADKEVIAGTGCESTAATIALTRAAAKAGATTALVVNPFYYMVTEDALADHYQAVADASPVPVLIYNVPKFTGVNMSATLVTRLARHENIAGIKDSSGNLAQMTSVLADAPKGFRVFSGTANLLYAACSLGCAGAISALANLAPEPLVRLVDLVKQGQHDTARELQLRLLPANIAITATYGVPGLKAAMDMCGYRGGLPRSPLKPANQTTIDALRDILKKAALLP